MNLHAEMTAAAGAASGVVDGVRPEQFGDPTPDTEWDVRTLLNHIILWTSHSLERRAHGESVAPELMDQDFAAEPGYAAEMVLHGWDLAAATGQSYAVDDAAAAAALAAVEANADLFRQYKGFAEPVAVAAGASVLARALALSGRDPNWSPSAA